MVCCCTTAREPLFDGEAVPGEAAWSRSARTSRTRARSTSGLAARATVVVESRASALREAGDVIQAIAAGALPRRARPLAALVRGDAAPAPGRPRLFKSTGMAWEDLVLAAAVHAAYRRWRARLRRVPLRRLRLRTGPETYAQLVRQLLDLRHGEYVDVEPGRWLIWHGRGIYGPTRYACGAHRGELKALVREEYGTVGPRPWAKGPHPWAGRRGTDRARRLARGQGQTFGR